MRPSRQNYLGIGVSGLQGLQFADLLKQTEGEARVVAVVEIGASFSHVGLDVGSVRDLMGPQISKFCRCQNSRFCRALWLEFAAWIGVESLREVGKHGVVVGPRSDSFLV